MANKPRMTIRLTPWQMNVLEELKETLNCNIALIIRAIIGDWLTKNEDTIYRIIEGEQKYDRDWLNNLKNKNNEQ